MLSLEDILSMPHDPSEEHLRSIGLLPQPAPTPSIIPPAKNIPAPSPVTAAAPVQPTDWRARLAATVPHAAPATAAPIPALTPLMEKTVASGPDLGTPGAAESPGPISPLGGKIPQLAPLNFKERQALPLTSEGVVPGSKESFEAQLARLQDQKNNPWGSPENHPGLLGKIGHYAAKIGNIAGDVLAPATMANIPGTDLNKKIEENQLEHKATAAEGRELAEKTEGVKERQEDTREQHEENVSEFNQKKIDEADKKIEADEKKHLSDREIGLRKQGLKPDPKDPSGPPIPLEPDEMSQLERDAHAVRAGRADAELAKAALDKIKADPNSPQSQASLERVRVMARNASTAAERLGLEKKKYLADYFGMDENLNPIPGAEKTPEGAPIGPKMARTTAGPLKELNKDYVKPSNDVERSYQMYQEAVKAYNSGDTQTGAATMLALSQHLGTTFGQIKGSRLNRDLIQEHKDAIGIFDKIERFGASLSRGDQLSASQMKEFGDLISGFRKLSWQTAAKEAKRANLPVDFLPADLNKEIGGGPTGGHPSEPPRSATAGMKWQQNKKTGEFREIPVTP